jgi:alanyl-tRNA synthetase
MASVSSKGQKEFKLDVGRMSKDLLPKFGGRGGGKPNFAQGSVADDTQPEHLFDSIKSYLNGGG